VFFSLVVALGGLFLGWLAYGRKPLKAGETDPAEVFLSKFKLPTLTEGIVSLHTFLNRRWLFDEFYRKYFIDPMQFLADGYSRVVDKGVIDLILHAGYVAGSEVANAFKWFDRKVVTGFSDLVGRVVRNIGDGGRELQTGQVQNYLLSGLIAAGAILVFFLFIFQ
jgi:NADH:ubiquinone oxidoreductase subunit 5 (subunit L)/multisubunit Na+/H+ antiporter MnhA subunit